MLFEHSLTSSHREQAIDLSGDGALDYSLYLYLYCVDIAGKQIACFIEVLLLQGLND
jgi:hypothetical protein